jgi:hypothetical protein
MGAGDEGELRVVRCAEACAKLIRLRQLLLASPQPIIFAVIPAKAGIHLDLARHAAQAAGCSTWSICKESWIPAFAGMTSVEKNQNGFPFARE